MKSPTKDGLRIRGFYRVQIKEGDKVVGDSGYHENLVVNNGFNDYLARLVGAISGSKQVSHLALGTGGLPTATDNIIAGEVVKRQAVTAATSSTSKTVRFTGTFDSANSFVTDTRNISNIGLFNTSTTGAGQLFAGNTFASSSVATNQNVNTTYDIIFA